MDVQDESKRKKINWVRKSGATAFDCHWRIGEWIGSANVAFCSGTVAFSFSKSSEWFFYLRGVWQWPDFKY